MTRFRGVLMILLACAVGLASTAVLVHAQGEQFQFIIRVSDAEGNPVTDLTTDDVLMAENGTPNKVVNVERAPRPVQLTIAVDNGVSSREALSHYRSGMEGLVKALPEDVEVAIITTAPQPRNVVPPTKDREQIFRGINLFAPESQSPRYTDALIEFSKRFEDDVEARNKMDSIPVLVMVSTSAPEVSSYQPPEISKALTFLRARRAMVHTVMISIRGDVADVATINESRQGMIAIPAAESTGGHYEALANSSRLATLLPEWGEEIAALHKKYTNQFVVTVERAAGLTGPLQNPQIGLERDGLDGEVSLDPLPVPPPMKQ